MLNINDNVIYTYTKTAIIENIHYDDSPNLYYTIKLNNLQRYPQTTDKNFFLINKIGIKYPFDKEDKVLYFKIFNTKIYDIITSNQKTKFKILYNNKFKYVTENKLRKI